MATSLEISKKEVQIDHQSAPKTLSFSEKIVKIGLADPEIIVLWEIVKKEGEKKKEINASKIHSPSGKFAERANNLRF